MPQARPKMASRGLYAAEPAKEPESKSVHFPRVLEGWGPSCMEKTICFMSSVYRRPRRSPRDGQKSKRAEKASFILCGKKYPPRTLFESYFSRGAKTFKNWCVFNIFKKSAFFIINNEEEIKNKMLALMHYLQHFHETDDFKSEDSCEWLFINVPHYQRKLQFWRFFKKKKRFKDAT